MSHFQVIGILRELRANGCVIKGFDDVNHVHYKQVRVTCGDVAKPLGTVE